MIKKRWTKQESQILKKNYKKCSKEEIINLLLGRTWGTIKQKANALQIYKRTRTKRWTQQELQILKDNYRHKSIEKVMKLLPNRTRATIHTKSSNLKIKKDYNSKWSKQERKMQLNPNVEQVLLGSLCGDGGLYIGKTDKNSYFKETHGVNQKNYLFSKMRILKQQLTMKIVNIISRKNISVSVRSFVHPTLTILHKLFYRKGIRNKLISREILNRLKPLGLAIWYQDDGSYSKWNNYCTIAIHKQNIKSIVKFFKEKLKMRVGVYERKKGNGASIQFSVVDTKKLFKMIKPYIHPSMKYKIKRTRKEQKQYRKQGREQRRVWVKDNPEKIREYLRRRKEKRRKNRLKK